MDFFFNLDIFLLAFINWTDYFSKNCKNVLIQINVVPNIIYILYIFVIDLHIVYKFSKYDNFFIRYKYYKKILTLVYIALNIYKSNCKRKTCEVVLFCGSISLVHNLI